MAKGKNGQEKASLDLETLWVVVSVNLPAGLMKRFRAAVIERHGSLRGYYRNELAEAVKAHVERMESERRRGG